MSKQRIDKIIASQGIGSRQDARRLINSGVVSINGAAVYDAAFKANPEQDSIPIRGMDFSYQKYVYIMMNKPGGVVSASRDPKAKTVLDLLPENLKRDGLFPAGRLDKDTTGFILITDDGDFAHKMLSPKSNISKTYIAALDKSINHDIISQFESGVKLSDGSVCLSAGLEAVSGDGTLVRVIIREGRYHQIKRMFAAVGLQVLSLRRISIGNLAMDTALAPGKCRKITSTELLNIIDK